MTNESSGGNYFQEEDDLQKWADDMGQSYQPGAQSENLQQPLEEQSTERRQARAGRYLSAARELGGFPVIPDEKERTLHVTPSQLDAMTDDERLKWRLDAMDWVLLHGGGLEDLIDPDPSPRPPDY